MVTVRLEDENMDLIISLLEMHADAQDSRQADILGEYLKNARDEQQRHPTDPGFALTFEEMITAKFAISKRIEVLRKRKLAFEGDDDCKFLAEQIEHEITDLQCADEKIRRLQQGD
jgi:hypothetical protein